MAKLTTFLAAPTIKFNLVSKDKNQVVPKKTPPHLKHKSKNQDRKVWIIKYRNKKTNKEYIKVSQYRECKPKVTKADASTNTTSDEVENLLQCLEMEAEVPHQNAASFPNTSFTQEKQMDEDELSTFLQLTEPVGLNFESDSFIPRTIVVRKDLTSENSFTHLSSSDVAHSESQVGVNLVEQINREPTPFFDIFENELVNCSYYNMDSGYTISMPTECDIENTKDQSDLLNFF